MDAGLVTCLAQVRGLGSAPSVPWPRKKLSYLLWLLISLVQGTSLRAQNYLTGAGAPSFTAPEPVELGFTDTANGRLHLEIPLGSFPERGIDKPLEVAWIYDSDIWAPLSTGTSAIWQPLNALGGGGWNFVPPGTGGTGILNQTTCASDYYWIDRNETRHYFPIHVSPDCAYHSGDAFATDSSGYHMYVTNLTNISVYAPDGTLMSGNSAATPCCGQSLNSEDSNGNYLSMDANNFYDTLGRPVYSFGACSPGQNCISISNSYTFNGLQSLYVVSYANIPVRTAFGQTGVQENSTTISVVASLKRSMSLV